MERTLSSELFSESNTVNTQASMPLRVLANLMLWQRRISSRHQDRKSTRLNSSHLKLSRMPSSA